MKIYKDPNTSDTCLAQEAPNGWVEIDQQELDAIRESRKIPLDQTTDIKLQIVELEIAMTPRRIREAILGIDDGWLANTETQIAALRAQL